MIYRRLLLNEEPHWYLLIDEWLSIKGISAQQQWKAISIWIKVEQQRNNKERNWN